MYTTLEDESLGEYHTLDALKTSMKTPFENEWDILTAGRRKVKKILESPVDLIVFNNFSATSASNGSLIEWKIALFHKKNIFCRSTYVLNQAIKKCQFFIFKVNFLCQKLSKSFSIFSSLKNINLEAYFLLLLLFESFNF